MKNEDIGIHQLKCFVFSSNKVQSLKYTIDMVYPLTALTYPFLLPTATYIPMVVE